MRTTVLIGLVASSLLLAGCTGGGITSSWRDAADRFCATVGGSDTQTESISIPAGTESLRVAANYNVGGQASFILKDPSGATKKSAMPSGGSSVNDDSWFQQSSPTPGDWSLFLQANGGATYCFGVYY